MNNQVRSEYNAYYWYWFSTLLCGPGRCFVQEIASN
jgi:hypothetical protein